MLDLGAIVAYNAFLHFHSHPPGIPSERVLLNLKQKKYWLHITLQSSIILEFRPVAKGDPILLKITNLQYKIFVSPSFESIHDENNNMEGENRRMVH